MRRWQTRRRDAPTDQLELLPDEACHLAVRTRLDHLQPVAVTPDQAEALVICNLVALFEEREPHSSLHIHPRELRRLEWPLMSVEVTRRCCCMRVFLGQQLGEGYAREAYGGSGSPARVSHGHIGNPSGPCLVVLGWRLAEKSVYTRSSPRGTRRAFDRRSSSVGCGIACSREVSDLRYGPKDPRAWCAPTVSPSVLGGGSA